jgi:hypothetical protein
MIEANGSVNDARFGAGGLRPARTGWSQLGRAGASSDGAPIDVGDIERSIAGAGICSIGAENNAPALAGARIEQFLARRR